jgi:hypothetical protein
MLCGFSGFPHLPENVRLVCAEASDTAINNNKHVHRNLYLIGYLLLSVENPVGPLNHPPRQFAKAYSNVSLVRQPYTRDGTAMQFGGLSGSCQACA